LRKDCGRGTDGVEVGDAVKRCTSDGLGTRSAP
jgi:hypothetical protein